jgi:glycosyltransferase involved in cell wall biosynthesis
MVRDDHSMRGLAITHVTDEYTHGGGVPIVVEALARNSQCMGARVQIVCAKSDALGVPPGVELQQCEPSTLAHGWYWSGRLVPQLRLALSATRAIAHVHGVWMAPHLVTPIVSKRYRAASVLSPHGMLSPYLFRYKGRLSELKKRMYWRLLAEPVFRRFSVVHAITDLEREWLAELMPDAEFVTIPNAVDMSLFDATPSSVHATSARRRLLFVGRIDPQKGIDILIRAFARAGLPKDIDLHIAGFGRGDPYEAFLRRLPAEEGIAERVHFVGPLLGDAKLQAYRDAWVVVVPSRMEVVGLVNLEAAASGTPTITTRETGLTRWSESGGLVVSANVDDLASALHEATRWSIDARHERGLLSRNFVEEHHSWERIRFRWATLYGSLA